MHLAFVSTLGGGVSSYIHTYAEWLLQQGHSVDVIYLGKAVDQSWQVTPRLTLRAVPIGNLHYYAARLGLSSLVGRIRTLEVNHAIRAAAMSIQNELHGIELIEGIGLPNLFNLPFAVKMHGAEWTVRHYCQDGEVDPFSIRRQRTMLQSAKLAMALSRSLADFITGACNVPRSTIEVTPYPINARKFLPSEPPQQHPPYKLMHVGRLEKRKGTHTLIEALRHVWKTEPDVHLYLFGGNGNFGRIQIEQVLPPSVHNGRIHFEGVVSRDALIEQYQSSHLYVTPTRYETFGYTILEAMACGRPVIATDIGPIPDLVRHEETGWLVPRDDPHALAETILAALRQPEKREAYGKAARRLAERYDVDVLMPQQLALYEKAFGI